MKVLVLAPHPFYQERGTPIAVNLLLRALSELGHTVDVITFPEGTAIHHPRCTLHRVRAPAFLRGVRPGFSLKKLVLDVLLFFRAAALTPRLRPDVIHAIEESVFIARGLSAVYGVPYLYDMDSSIPDQIVERYPRMRRLQKAMHRLFRLVTAPALAVIPVCPALAQVARQQYGAERVLELHDISLLPETCDVPPLDLRGKHGIRGCLFMYIGNLEHYQGIDLLVEAFALHHKRRRDDALVVIGGPVHLIEAHRQRAAELGCDAGLHFLGPQPAHLMGAFFREADVLTSPRIKGQNTPMKIYSYLDSGRAVLATRLYTHTQIVNDEHCLLADPTPEQFAEGMRLLASSPDRRAQLAASARALIQRRHSYPAFRATVESVYNYVAEARNGTRP